MPKEIKKCPNCLNSFTLKRLNQKYCSDNCRIETNNLSSRTFRELTKTTNHILLKNRNILAELEGEQISVFDLKVKGYQFGYVTNFRTQQNSGGTEFICYDYGYFAVKTKNTELVEVFKV